MKSGDENTQKKLEDYIVLNKYMYSLFGKSEFNELRRILKNKPEGLNDQNQYHFTEALKTIVVKPELKEMLDQYDENIQKYMEQINKKRFPKIELKYYQYLAILFTELYLDRYFNDFDNFYRELTSFASKFFSTLYNIPAADVSNENKEEEHPLREEKKEKKTKASKKKKNEIESHKDPSISNEKQTIKTKKSKSLEAKPPVITPLSMRKLVYWSATGSGKTILMHINMLQMKKYVNFNYDNFMLITPNEGLSYQHIQELDLSNIPNKKFDARRTLENWTGEAPVKVIEITKIKDEVSSQDGKSVPVEAFGDRNIIFIDEGHKGNSSEAKVWKKNREEIAGHRGFIFEYSATFAEITATPELFNEYAASIIVDYHYKYFYEDGFGKDYSILNLKDNDLYGEEYLTFALLSFYEQVIYYQRNKTALKPFNIENPLMIFVGTSVSGKQNNSDVLKLCRFLSDFINSAEKYQGFITNILNGKSSLTDENGVSLTQYKLQYLRKIITQEELTAKKIYEHILSQLFYTNGSTSMQFIEIKNADGEIGLKFGNSYFAVINIGDVSAFLKLIEAEKNPNMIRAAPSQFEKSLFHQIEKPDSPIYMLIGSKKFMEGWNSYRVSSMGLINIGKSQGTQVIQLFGRGVRLRGYDHYLKRALFLMEENLIPNDVIIPEDIQIVETLNIFGLNANYMMDFKMTLLNNGWENYEKVKLTIKRSGINSQLFLPKLSKDPSLFTKEVFITNLKIPIAKYVMDLTSKVYQFESHIELRPDQKKKSIVEMKIPEDILEVLDISELYLELLEYKRIKRYFNMYFTKQDIIYVLKHGEYGIRCYEDFLKINPGDTMEKLFKIQAIALQLAKGLLDKIFNTQKYRWLQGNLTISDVKEMEEALYPNEYVFIINSDMKEFKDHLLKFMEQFERRADFNNIKNMKEIRVDTLKDLNNNPLIDFISMNVHLFQPLIFNYSDNHGKEYKFVKISPTSLFPSEYRFLRTLEQYLESKKEENQKKSIFLLRNPVKKGVKFFETKGFYPDFILWLIEEGKTQRISFIDPKGLRHLNLNDEKIQLHKEIKIIEKQLENDAKNRGFQLSLNSFILSETSFKDLGWAVKKEDCEKENIFFLEDGIQCIEKMMEKIMITEN